MRADLTGLNWRIIGVLQVTMEDYGVEPESFKMELPDKRSLTFVRSDSNDGASRPNMEGYGVNLESFKMELPEERSLSLVSNDSNDGASWPDMEGYGVDLKRSRTPPPNMEDYGVEPDSSKMELPDMSALKKKTTPVRINSMSPRMRKI